MNLLFIFKDFPDKENTNLVEQEIDAENGMTTSERYVSYSCELKQLAIDFF